MKKTIKIQDRVSGKDKTLTFSNEGITSTELLTQASQQYVMEVRGEPTTEGPVFSREVAKITSSCYIPTSKTSILTESSVEESTSTSTSTSSVSNGYY